MFRVPGFVSEVMDHCLATAPYPNVPLAFCGALALQAMLAGRKVRDAGDNRTNLYLLALAYSSVGKDWPRKVNTHVLHRVGLVESLGEKFASGEGIQDALFRTPAMLFQTDEIDGLLQSINKAQDARHENILGTLLTMYSASNSIFPMRRKAGKESPGVIDQPCLVVYGTAIPTHYYEALSERMLTNGFFARMLIVESGPRSAGQEPGIIDPPPRVLETARWWADFWPGTRQPGDDSIPRRDGRGGRRRPDAADRGPAGGEAEYADGRGPRRSGGHHRLGARPRADPQAGAAVRRQREPRVAADRPGRRAVGDRVHPAPDPADAVHGAQPRGGEPVSRRVPEAAAKTARGPDQTLPHSVLLKRMKIDAKSFAIFIDTLCQQGEIQVVTTPRAGWPVRAYRLVEGETYSGGET